VLSLTLPIPMIALLVFTNNRDLMGEFVNRRVTTIAASFAAAVVLILNLVLLLQSAGLDI
jgi:manganese transport protein